jgi:hypothetical protein
MTQKFLAKLPPHARRVNRHGVFSYIARAIAVVCVQPGGNAKGSGGDARSKKLRDRSFRGHGILSETASAELSRGCHPVWNNCLAVQNSEDVVRDRAPGALERCPAAWSGMASCLEPRARSRGGCLRCPRQAPPRPGLRARTGALRGRCPWAGHIAKALPPRHCEARSAPGKAGRARAGVHTRLVIAKAFPPRHCEACSDVALQFVPRGAQRR